MKNKLKFLFTFIFSFSCLFMVSLPTKAIKFSIGTKKQKKPSQPGDTNIKDDEDYIDRSQLDLSQLKTKEFKAHGVVDDVGVFRIKAILQDNSAVYKVNHVGFKKYYIYFKKGKTLSNKQISSLVKVAGYKVSDIKTAKSATNLSKD